MLMSYRISKLLRIKWPWEAKPQGDEDEGEGWTRAPGQSHVPTPAGFESSGGGAEQPLSPRRGAGSRHQLKVDYDEDELLVRQSKKEKYLLL